MKKERKRKNDLSRLPLPRLTFVTRSLSDLVSLKEASIIAVALIDRSIDHSAALDGAPIDSYSIYRSVNFVEKLNLRLDWNSFHRYVIEASNFSF